MTQYIFNSGIDSLKQALDHLNQYEMTNDHKHLRFALIHLDGSIELLLLKSLIDKGINVMDKFGKTKGILNCLDEFKKGIIEDQAEEEAVKELKQFIYFNEIVLLHRYRNEAQHIGSITKEDQLIEIINKVLESLMAYLDVIFNRSIVELDSYIRKLGRVMYPLELYFEEANKLMRENRIKEGILKKFNVIDNLITNIYENLIMEIKNPSYSREDIIEYFDEIIKNEELIKRYSKEELDKISNEFHSIVYDVFFIMNSNDDPYIEINLTEINISLNSVIDILLNVYRSLKMKEEMSDNSIT